MLVRVIVRVRARGPGSGGPGSGGPWAEGEGSGARDARGPDAWGRRVGQAEGPRGCARQRAQIKHIFIGFYPREGRYMVRVETNYLTLSASQPASQPSQPASQPVSFAILCVYSIAWPPSQPAIQAASQPASQPANGVGLLGVALLYESPGGNQVDGLPPVPA